MRKRSHRVALCIVGAAAFTLAGCREEQVDAQAFPDLDSCRAAAQTGGTDFSTADCDAAFAEAQQIHLESAPRYDSLEVCEEQHGEGACGSEQQVAGGGGMGSIFMPLLAGYLIGNMLGRGMPAAQPLYRGSDGRFTNATGTTAYSGNTGRTQLSPSQFNRPPTTVGKPPMTKTTVTSRGGFGNSATGRSIGT
ncbi:DUF1190 domain-containing protein [Cereibacter azotoformans]|uniref:Uncharacterized protein YgiB involved in biofilm formation n=2 Tax=Cereibacter TaxID=1653176 RepID=A0A2T5K5R8_9RHOB|nr:DUF1190 domain-containing protein [Cereibacter azotoformans]AXQ95559.1 DUF1190 domain-containing protein [Cereibacter sphaeroides]PTR17744.1 uncharacterized protein YgiB involved in biofilm formation [Cereibacter azotoformans]UIJ32196.1 DUF1190 domain-containing protein [Cereibacter azotoformans]ULB11913.1 DUF1190 domain-containing protein [Cereibacter azotoformans]